MGLLLPHVIFTTRMCLENHITDSIISLGRLDFFITFKQFTDLMIDYSLAFSSPEMQIGIKFNNDTINTKVIELIKNKKHISRSKAILSNNKVISDSLYYTSLGFDKVDCIDIDPSQNQPTILFDLNQSNILQTVNRKYNLVIDAGVLEHVFDIRNSMLNTTDLVENQGFIIQIISSNNTMDHGFYQISPTFFQDYYLANKYKIISIMLLKLQQNKFASPNALFTEKWDQFRMWDYDPYIASKNSFGQLSDNIYYTLVCAQKTTESLRDVIPQQYASQPNAKIMSPW